MENSNTRDTEPELTVRVLESKCSDLEAEISTAAAKKDFVSAGMLSKELKDAQEHLEELRRRQVTIEPVPSLNIRQLENDVNQIQSEMKQAVANRNFVLAGEKQRALLAKQEELENAKKQLREAQEVRVPMVDLSQLEQEVKQIDKEMQQAVADRNFVLAGQKQKELFDKQRELEEAQKAIPQEPKVNLRQLENDIAKLDKEMKEAVSKKNFVLAGQKQKELNEKKEELEAAKRTVEQKSTGPAPNLRQLESECAELEREMKEAVARKDFVLAGQTQKELNEKKAELENAKAGKIAHSVVPGPNLRSLERECDCLEAEMREAVANRNFVLAGQKQKEYKDKKNELENAKKGISFQIDEPTNDPLPTRFDPTADQTDLQTEGDIENLDEIVFSIEKDMKEIQRNIDDLVNQKNFQAASRLKSQLEAKQKEYESEKQALIEKRQKYLEDIYVTDMKQGWLPSLQEKELDLSEEFKKPNGSFSVSLGIDRTKRAEIITPREFYVMSSTTHTYHKLVVKYKPEMADEARSPYLTNLQDGINNGGF